eukprot:979440_1
MMITIIVTSFLIQFGLNADVDPNGYRSFQEAMKKVKENARIAVLLLPIETKDNGNTKRETLRYFIDHVNFINEHEFNVLNEQTNHLLTNGMNRLVQQFEQLATPRLVHVANPPFMKGITALIKCYRMFNNHDPHLEYLSFQAQMERFKESARVLLHHKAQSYNNTEQQTLMYFINTVHFSKAQFTNLNDRSMHKFNNSVTQRFARLSSRSLMKAIAVMNKWYRALNGYLSFQEEMKRFKESARFFIQNNNNNTQRQALLYFINTVEFNEAQFNRLNDRSVQKSGTSATQRFVHQANESFMDAIIALNNCYKLLNYQRQNEKQKQLSVGKRPRCTWCKKASTNEAIPCTPFSLFEEEMKCLTKMAKKIANDFARDIPASSQLTKNQTKIMYAIMYANQDNPVAAILFGKIMGDDDSDDEDNEKPIDIDSHLNYIEECLDFIDNNISEEQFDIMDSELKLRASHETMGLTEMISRCKNSSVYGTIAVVNRLRRETDVVKQKREKHLKEIMDVIHEIRWCIENGSQDCRKRAEELAVTISIGSKQQAEIFVESVGLLPIYSPKWYFLANILLAKHREFQTFGCNRVLRRDEVQALREEIEGHRWKGLCKGWLSNCTYGKTWEMSSSCGYRIVRKKCKFYHGEPLQWDDTSAHDHETKPLNIRRKTRLCRYFADGKCVHGSHCDFAHGKDELRDIGTKNIKEKPARNSTVESTRDIVEKPPRVIL